MATLHRMDGYQVSNAQDRQIPLEDMLLLCSSGISPYLLEFHNLKSRPGGRAYCFRDEYKVLPQVVSANIFANEGAGFIGTVRRLIITLLFDRRNLNTVNRNSGFRALLAFMVLVCGMKSAEADQAGRYQSL